MRGKTKCTDKIVTMTFFFEDYVLGGLDGTI